MVQPFLLQPYLALGGSFIANGHRPHTASSPEEASTGSIQATASGYDSNEVVKAFAANSSFRAATLAELVNDSNSFRRPVRPDDLDFLDYSTELPVEDVGNLSWLLGHRMLLNAYETDLLFLPEAEGSASWTDSRSFYSPENRLLAELARPVLEHHLFSFLEQPVDGSELAGSLVDHVVAEAERLGRQDRVGDVIRALQDPAAAARFQLIQLSAMAASRAAAFGRGGLGDDAGVGVTGWFLDVFEQERRRLPTLRELMLDCDLSDGPRAYWQFYLGSTLASATYLHRVCRDRAQLFEAIGALVHHIATQPVLSAHYGALLEVTLGVGTPYFDQTPLATGQLRTHVEAIVCPLLARYGDDFAVGCRRGFDAAARLASIAEDDVVIQVSWVDQLELYKAKGNAIRRHIRDQRIDVDLDTFVESCEETSTTHVHDDHRLVVIERGEMRFWNNIGATIPLSTGDAILIPKGRLHGSTVLSGECTYHQPIISDAMLAEVA